MDPNCALGEALGRICPAFAQLLENDDKAMFGFLIELEFSGVYKI